MHTIRRSITHTMDWICATWLDPLWHWPPPLRWVARRLGCPAGLGRWAAELDERWRTGLYEGTQPTTR